MFGDVASYFAQGDAALYAVVLGVLVPWVVGVFNRVQWNASMKLLVAGSASALAALGDLYFTGQLSGHKLTTTILVVFLVATIFYKAVFRVPATQLEVATTPLPKPAKPFVPAGVSAAQVGQVDAADGE